MELRSLSRPRYGVLFLLLFLVRASYCLREPQSESKHQFPALPQYLSGSVWVFGDLDGDHKPDVAKGHPSGRTEAGYLYEVQLQLSGAERSTSLTVFHNNALGLRISGIDIDGDNDIDLIISDRFSRKHTGVWLNDGKGRFTRSAAGRFAPYSDEDLAFVAIHQSWAAQPTEVKQSRRLTADLSARYTQCTLLPPTRMANQQTVEWIIQLDLDPQHQRAPPHPLML
jgi:hypothetical protein